MAWAWTARGKRRGICLICGSQKRDQKESLCRLRVSFSFRPWNSPKMPYKARDPDGNFTGTARHGVSHQTVQANIRKQHR